MKLRELFVELGIEADEDEAKNFEEALGNVKERMKDVAKQAAAMGAAITGAFGGLALLSAREAEFAEEASRVSEAFGLSTDRYQELRFAFQSLHASSDDLHASFSKLSRRVQRASNGAQTYEQAFNAIGLSYEDLIGLPVSEQFDKFVEASRGAEEQAVALASASQILGDDLGRRLMPGMLSTNNAFEDFEAIAQNSSLVIDEDLLEAADKANKKFRLLGAVFTALFRTIGIRLAPMFGRLAQNIANAILSIEDYIVNVASSFADLFEEEVEKIRLYFENLNEFVQGTLGGWIPVLASLAGSFAAITAILGAKPTIAALAALKKAFIALTAGGIAAAVVSFGWFILIALAVIAVIVALILIIEDIIGYFSGADSWIGNFIDAFGKANDMWGGMATLIEELMATLSRFIYAVQVAWNWLLVMMSAMWTQLKGLFDRIMPFLMALGAILVILIVMVGGAIALIIGFIFAFITALTWIVNLLFDIVNFVVWGIVGLVQAVFGHFDTLLEWGSHIRDMFGSLVDGAKNLASVIPGVDLTDDSSHEVSREVGHSNLEQEASSPSTRPGGGHSETNVRTGDTNVEVQTAEGDDVSEEVAQRTAERTEEEQARALSSAYSE